MNKYLILIKNQDNEDIYDFVIKTDQTFFLNKLPKWVKELVLTKLNYAINDTGMVFQEDEIDITFYHLDEQYYEVIDLTKELTNDKSSKTE